MLDRRDVGLKRWFNIAAPCINDGKGNIFIATTPRRQKSLKRSNPHIVQMRDGSAHDINAI